MRNTIRVRESSPSTISVGQSSPSTVQAGETSPTQIVIERPGMQGPPGLPGPAGPAGTSEDYFGPIVVTYDPVTDAVNFDGAIRAASIYAETITAGSGGIASGAALKADGAGEFRSSDPASPTIYARMAPAQIADSQTWASSSGTEIASLDSTGTFETMSLKTVQTVEGNQVHARSAVYTDSIRSYTGAPIEITRHSSSPSWRLNAKNTTFEAGQPDNTPIIIYTAPGQTASSQEWRNSSGSKFAEIDMYGRVYGHSFHPTSLGQNSPAIEARNTAPGGSNLLWAGYDTDGIAKSTIGRQGDLRIGVIRHYSDDSIGFNLHANARIDIVAPSVWLSRGAGFFMQSGSGSKSANFALLEDGTFNAAINPSAQSWEDADSVMIGNKSPGQSQRSAIRASGAIEAFVHHGNGRAGHGAVTPLTVYHDGDQAGLSGPPTGDLIIAQQGLNKKFWVTKTEGVAIKATPAQTSDVLSVQDSSGSALAWVTPTGDLGGRSITTNTLRVFGEMYNATSGGGLTLTAPNGSQKKITLKDDGTFDGIIGTPGPKGDTGDAGPQGERGIDGATGPRGNDGAAGERGLQGVQGIPGDKGGQGDKGDKGDQGIQGIQGVKGDTGNQGIQGIQGVKGLDGGGVGAGPVNAVRLFKASTQNVASYQAIVLTNFTTEFNAGGNFEVVGGNQIKILQAGYYSVHVGTSFTNTSGSGNRVALIYKNGVNTREIGLAGGNVRISGGDLMYLVANDVVSLAIYSDHSAVMEAGTKNTWLSIAKHNGDGAKGDQGIQGVKGDTGPQGIQGIQGIKGDTGPQGPAGTGSSFDDADAITQFKGALT